MKHNVILSVSVPLELDQLSISNPRPVPLCLHLKSSAPDRNALSDTEQYSCTFVLSYIRNLDP